MWSRCWRLNWSGATWLRWTIQAHKVAGVEEAIRAAGASVLYLPSYSPHLNPIEQVFAKRRFSELASQASCNQKDARALKQRLDDEAKPIIAEGQALVLQHPSVAALHGPAALAQP